jgi:hypothetical protein
MWHETITTREVLRYFEINGTAEEREETYRILYPSHGGNRGASLGSSIPFGNTYARLAGAIARHAANGLRKVPRHD